MRAREIMETASTGATAAGSFAPVAKELGMVSRQGGSLISGKYTTDPTPNTPKEYQRKKHVGRRFENSISN